MIHFILKISLLLSFLYMICFPASFQTTRKDNDTIQPYLEFLKKKPEDTEALYAVGLHYLRLGNLAKAQEYGKMLVRIGDKENDWEHAKLHGHLILGLSYIDNNNNTEGYRHLELAKMLAERFQDHKALTSILNGLGFYSLLANDDTYSALFYYFQALDEAKFCNNRRMYSSILANISGVYNVRNEMEGLKYVKEGLKIAQEDKELMPQYYCQMNAAFFYLLSDSLTQAQDAIDKAKQLYKIIKLETDEADLDILQALLNKAKGNKAEAYSHFSKAINHFDKATPSTKSKVCLEYARLLKDDNHIDEAIRILERGIQETDSSGVPIHKTELLKELSLIYRQKGNTNKALEYAFLLQDCQQQHFDKARKRALAEAQITHDLQIFDR